MLAGIDLDQHIERDAAAAAGFADRQGNGKVVGNQVDRRAVPLQVGDRVELAGHDPNGVGDVGIAFGQKIRGLGQGGDGNAAEISLRREAGDGRGLRGFHMRSETDAVAAKFFGHGLGIARNHRAVEHQCWRAKGVERRCHTISPPALFQASIPPVRWQTSAMPRSFDVWTAMAERSPNAQ